MLSINRKVRVLVVDDSAVARTFLTRGLSSYPNIEVVGYAVNALDARGKISSLAPDVMTLDVEMPGTNGIDFLKELLPVTPLPVILVSSLNLKVFDALAAGAVDFVRKPDGTESKQSFLDSLAQKIVVASCAKVRRRAAVSPAAPSLSSVSPAGVGGRSDLDRTIIGLGASTGGTEATLEVLKRLPADIPGMVIVQHMPVGFTKMYAERLNRLCRMEVREAGNGDEIRRGLALIAPADLQARVVLPARRKGQRPPPLRGRPVLLHGLGCEVPYGGHHHDRHGTGWRRRPAPNAPGRRLYHWSGQGLLRGLRNAHGRL